jgi:hypothetical protein
MLILALTLQNAKENGTDIKISTIMAIVNFALKMKLKNQKRLRKIHTLIYCSTAKELVNQKT